MRNSFGLFLSVIALTIIHPVSASARDYPAHSDDSKNTKNLYAATGVGGNEKVGKTQYPLNVTKFGNNCYYIDPDRNIAARKDAQVDIPNFPCPFSGEDETNGGFNPLNDMFYYLGVVVDMYRSYLDSEFYSKQMTGVVVSRREDNDYFDASTSSINVALGDTTEYPLTVLDVIGHEVAHAYTMEHSALVSGGMNEAFSDMSGEAAKYFLYGKSDYLWAANAMRPGALQQNGQPKDAIRYLCDPTRDGYSVDNYKDVDKAANAHYSAGIYNKAFCLLSKSPSWDPKLAFQVFARANAQYWAPNTTMPEGACGVLHAAKDLGRNTADVRTAFKGVGIDVCSTQDIPRAFTKIVAFGGTPLYAQSTTDWPTNVGFPKTGFPGARFRLMLDSTSAYDTIWRSSDESVATVGQNGMVTLRGPGEATITASVNSVDIQYQISPNKWFFIATPTSSLNWSQQKDFCQSQGAVLPAIENLTSSTGSVPSPKIGALFDEWGDVEPLTVVLTGGEPLVFSSTLQSANQAYAVFKAGNIRLTRGIAEKNFYFACQAK